MKGRIGRNLGMTPKGSPRSLTEEQQNKIKEEEKKKEGIQPRYS